MKRWYSIALAAAAVAAVIYVYSHWGGQAIGTLFAGTSAAGSPEHLQWHLVERPGDGFKVELPGPDKDLQVPAYNETGGTEPVNMLVSNLNGDITYAVTWQDNPPVVRVAHSPDRTLNMARDGMLTRTETTIVSESRAYQHGRPSLEVLARNNGGGVLHARLILADDRLYILMATFPSESARRPHDVKRFLDSFVPAVPGGIPETMPEATQ